MILPVRQPPKKYSIGLEASPSNTLHRVYRPDGPMLGPDNMLLLGPCSARVYCVHSTAIWVTRCDESEIMRWDADW